MADKNLTNALFTLKEKETKPSPAPGKQNPAGTSAAKKQLPFRKRSFDTFFGFSITLLVVTLFAQVIALIAYS